MHTMVSFPGLQAEGRGGEPLPNVKGADYHAPGFAAPVEEVTDIDPRDKGTPDDWVPRHPELVRLTGRHPFNVEPPLWRLVDKGFITPTSLHYVRNHGAVPRGLKWETHLIRISGCVSRPFDLTMDQLVADFTSVTLPVTLVCAGNRRKEENMIKQGLGFSWGAAAVSTSLWTGVWLRDVLARAGIKSHEEGARHVCLVGADKLPNGAYGTSIRRAVAMDETADVLLAYKQNGELLAPDHGFPIRVIIPGYIGGRMVKWLSSITVTALESENHYHYFDNRVLPPQVDAERAAAEGWWKRPEYIINELNINSAIAYPRNGELISLGSGAGEYTIRGYAYAGGGLAITRVEVTLDGGETWELATLNVPEKPRAMGRYWCWVFWEFRLDMVRLLGCKDVACRAWQGQNTQPGNLTWNVLGMMNNCWFKMKVHPARDESNGVALTFEHPTMPGQQPGGWMNREGGPTAAAAKVVVAAAKAKAPADAYAAGKLTAAPMRKYTLEEVAKHDSETDCWIAISDKVYDCTPFLKAHPGGADSILLCAGEDATDEFNALHSEKARKLLADYYVGDLVPEGQQTSLDEERRERQASGGVVPAPLASVSDVSAAVSAAVTASKEAAAAAALLTIDSGGVTSGYTSDGGASSDSSTASSSGNSNRTTEATVVNGSNGSSINKGGCKVAPAAAAAVVSAAAAPVAVVKRALDGKKKVSLKLHEKTVLTHNSRRFRFALPSAEHVLGLPVGKHVMVSGRRKGTTDLVMRAYTPATGDELRGFVDLVVKVYFPCERFPQGGKMSQLLDELSVGDTIDFKGPIGEITYLGDGNFDIQQHSKRRYTQVAMLAGGTGITPMHQIIQAVLSNPADPTKLSLVYANVSEDDILMRAELDDLAARHPDRFRVWYTVDRVANPEDWAFDVGFIGEQMLKDHLAPAAADAVAFMCGPPPMLKFACLPNLAKLGYDADTQCFSF